ncbi:hypothetical protein GWI72_10995 [Microvirga tunisiensis]|uniref:Uncharacterized protein n=1 Tax=Pannonibacter tanglangensis TaxID=2750084 RepID=A0A7X5J8K4_9HYPH|nr:hypothetical protein [Pannonibacter sp. XCT-53]NBN78794.1 hypothetical protein [Pannonibacter sp. XCT-53]
MAQTVPTGRRGTWLRASALLAAGVAVLTALSTGAGAQSLKKPDLVTGDDPDRFALVQVEGDYLRLDRRLGDISLCEKRNEIWRCAPVPDAERAYLAEIERLSAEVTELKARLASLGPVAPSTPSPAAPGPAPSAPSDVPPTGLAPQPAPGSGPRLSEKDEQQLEEVLGFTELAMRRFFGLMRDLQQEMER